MSTGAAGGGAPARPVVVDLAVLRHFFGLAPFMVELGVEVVDAADGRVTTRMPVARKITQHTGVVHAGALATLVDHTMGAAAQMAAPPEHWVMTAELKTSVLRPGVGEWLECTGWVLKGGRQVSFTEGEVWACRTGGERVLVLKASATMAVALKPPQPGSGAAQVLAGQGGVPAAAPDGSAAAAASAKASRGQPPWEHHGA